MKLSLTFVSILGNGCTCDTWCRKRGHCGGGVCGDEDTCICLSTDKGRKLKSLVFLETTTAAAADDDLTEGTICTCAEWCREKYGSPFGICRDGPQCICTEKEATKEEIGTRCMCDAWCRKRGHCDGGVCGDGNTCICSSTDKGRKLKYICGLLQRSELCHTSKIATL
ncbi:unnamed protein product [Adineta steineri]|uniref:Uncharacterized protein n=1 Tax=Adineta steineri TaxID=433720 RepID=A0A814WIK4_9BILA|nr:unnamed protein product [Adineta steineri]